MTGNPVLDDDTASRHPLLLAPGDTALLVIDLQEKLIALIPEGPAIVWNARRLIDGARLLGVPILGTEQYPQGLGPTVEPIAGRLGPLPDKLAFSCWGCDELVRRLKFLNVVKVLLCGIETHVCVQQTAYDLMAAGYHVQLAVDATGCRFDIDYRTATRRMDSAGVTLTTTEAALFELCGRAGTPEFKEISRLVREPPPGAGPG